MSTLALPSNREEAWRWSDLSALPELAERRPSGRVPDALPWIASDQDGPRLLFIDGKLQPGGNVGTEFVAKSPPDGYTIELGTNGTHTVNHSLYSNPPFNGVKDFAAITKTANTPNVLVLHPSVKANSVKELIALAKARPGEINYASPGPGTPPHLAAEIFRTMAGIKIVHVPYKGAGPASVDLLGGHVQIMIMNRGSVAVDAGGTEDNAQAKSRAGHWIHLKGTSSCGPWGDYEVELSN